MQTRLVTAVLLVLACNPKSPGTDTGSSASETEGASVTSATDTDPTGEPPASTGPDGTTTTTTTTTTSETTEATGPAPITTSATDGETGGEGLKAACVSMCMHLDMCSRGSVGPIHECVAQCSGVAEEPSPCAAALALQWNCVAGLACEEALKFIDGPEPTSCLEELGNADLACGGEECNGEIGGDEVTCSRVRDCGDGEQEYNCDGDTCTCLQDGVAGKQCPAGDFCSQGPDEVLQTVATCCGWDWS